jgi:hypothetical protein
VRLATLMRRGSKVEAELLVRIEAEVLALPAPLHVGITHAFNIDAAREASFDRSLDELRSQESERECQIDLAHRASLAFRQLLSVSDCA